MSIEKAIEQVLLEAAVPAIEKIYLYTQAKADENTFAVIIPLKADPVEAGQCQFKPVNQPVWVAVLKKIGDDDVNTVIAELETIGQAVKKIFYLNKKLSSTLYPDGFCVATSITELEKGNTTTGGVSRCRYYRFTLYTRYFGSIT